MRGFQLARIAAEAEKMRLHGFVRRHVVRLIFGVMALFFLVGALVFAHLAAWYWLRTGPGLSFLATAAIFGGVDVLIAIVLALLATRSGPSPMEIEAIAVRRQALAGIEASLRLTTLAITLLRAFTAGRHRNEG